MYFLMVCNSVAKSHTLTYAATCLQPCHLPLLTHVIFPSDVPFPRTQNDENTSKYLRGTTLEKSAKFAILFFLHKKARYILVDQIPKYHGASTTVSRHTTGPKGGNASTFITFFYDLLLFL